MSNDDDFAPPPPEDGSESGLGGLAAEPPENGATESDAGADDPTEAMPPESGGAEPPAADPTRVMDTGPVTPRSTPIQSGAGIPPIVPPADAQMVGEPVVPAEEFDEPWYRQPRAWALIAVGVIIVGLLIVLLFLLGGDDDEGGLGELSTDPVVLVVVRSQSGGAALDTSLSVSVTAQQSAPDDYVWIAPEGAVVGQPAELQTDATGRAEFRWAPAEGNPDGTWSTSVEMAEAIAPEGDAPVSGIGADCQLERDGTTETLVVQANVQVDQTTNVGVGTYRFPNVTFGAGDRVTCTMVNQIATPPPTTIAETTVPETTTTTTVVETTVAPTTAAPTTAPPTTAAPTTAAPTTAAPTTAAPTTAAPTTAPPTTLPSAPTLGDFLTDNGLTGFRDLLAQADVLDEIESSSQPFTLFAATDQAVNAFLSNFDPVTTDLEDVVRAHLSYEGALDSADLQPLQELDVDFGGPQPLDFTAQPPTVGGAEVVEADKQVEDTSAGIVHVIDTVLTPQP